MKRILFLKPTIAADTAKRADWALLSNAIQELLGSEYEIKQAGLSRLAFLAAGKHMKVWHPKEGWDLIDFDLVVFRWVGQEQERAISAAHYLRSKGVPFIDQYLLMPGKGKLAGVFLRTANGLPSPRTFYASHEISKAVFKNQPPFDYPLVLKADAGRKGRDNYLIHNYDELCQILDQNQHLTMIAQEFIPNDGDLRVLVLNNKIKLVMRRKSKTGSHLNNISQGAEASLLPMDYLSKKIQVACKRAAQLEHLQVAGVDLIIDKRTAKYYFLEINRAPQLFTGAFVDEKIQAYADMVVELGRTIASAHPKKQLVIIGRAEHLTLRDTGITVPARVDTGAKTSAIWASKVRVDAAGILHFRLFDNESEFFSGETYRTKEFEETVVSSSNGAAEKRYKVKLRISLGGRNINASFTLADRSTQVYPVLIGRNILQGKFVVNVRLGDSQHNLERQRTERLRTTILTGTREKV